MRGGLDEKNLGLVIGQLRREAGLTQQELCQKTGLSYSTLAKIERGAIKSPSIFTIAQIAEELGSPINKILGIDSNKSTASKKRSKSGIEFVYFDVHGCLIRFFHRAFTQVAHETGISTDKIESAFWHYNDLACRGDITMEEFNASLARKLNLGHFNWEEHYLPSVESVPNMHELMDWATQYYKVGLMSNIMPGLLSKLKENKLIPNKKYDAIIDSSQVKSIKPEQKIYEIAASKANVDPASIMLIDDSRTNLMAAEKMGWKVLWFDDYNPEESVRRIKQALEY